MQAESSTCTFPVLVSVFHAFLNGIESTHDGSVHFPTYRCVASSVASPCDGLSVLVDANSFTDSKRMSLKAKLIVFSILIALAIPMILAGCSLYLFFAAPAIENASQQIPFDSAKWKADGDSSGVMWPTRLRMIDDLIRSKKLEGRTESEVIRLLGSPDNRNLFNDLVYHLGPERGVIRIDSESLLIRLDKNNTVKTGKLFTD